jgi:hypothetical protein
MRPKSVLQAGKDLQTTSIRTAIEVRKVTPAQLASIVRDTAFQSAVEGLVANLQRPPGRSPSKDLTAASTWYKALPESDVAVVDSLIRESARAAIFGVLATLDGIRTWSPDDDGTFELWHRSSEGNQLVNPPSGEMLHEAFTNVVPPPA